MPADATSPHPGLILGFLHLLRKKSRSARVRSVVFWLSFLLSAALARHASQLQVSFSTLTGYALLHPNSTHRNFSLSTLVGGFASDGEPVMLVHGPEETSAKVSWASSLSVLDIVKACPSLWGEKARYKAPWWLSNGNMQTMWNTIGDHTKTDLIPYDRVYLRVPDNGTLVLDTYPPLSSTPPSTPIVVILHGITGSSQEAYTRSTVTALSSIGYRSVAVNFRGCDGSPVTSSRLYHAGETDDFRSVLLFLSKTYPEAPLYAVGFSMGANNLAVYLGEEGRKMKDGESGTMLKAAVAVSNPWDWVQAAQYLEHGTLLNKYVYGPVLGGALRTIFLRNVHAFDPRDRSNIETFPKKDWGIDIEEVENKKYHTIRWYDDRVTSKLFNFADGEDYYTKTSSLPHLPHIRTPLLALHARDDPILADYYMPWDMIRRGEGSEWVVGAVTSGGGHVGWFVDSEGEKKGQLKRWYGDPIVQFLMGVQAADSTPLPSPPTTLPNSDGMIYQANLPRSRGVGFVPVKGASYSTDNGRTFRGF